MNKNYPKKVEFRCKCGNNKLEIFWILESYGDALNKSLCHDGFGLIIDDATIKCPKCKQEKLYGDFETLEK